MVEGFVDALLGRHRNRKETRDLGPPERVLFIVNIHPNESYAPIVAEEVKALLEESGFSIPIEIVPIPELHESLGRSIPWYELIARKGIDTREQLTDIVITRLLQERRLDRERVSRIDFHCGEQSETLSQPLAHGSSRHLLLEVPAIFRPTSDAQYISLASRGQVRRKLGVHDIRYLERETDTVASQEACHTGQFPRTIAAIVRHITTEPQVSYDINMVPPAKYFEGSLVSNV